MGSSRGALARDARPLFLLLLPLLSLATASDTRAQILNGIVRDERGAAVQAASVIARLAAPPAGLDSLRLGPVLSDSAGRFQLRLPAGGEYILTLEHLAHVTVSVAIAIEAGEEVAIEVRMAGDAVALDPLVVLGRRRAIPLRLAGFHERKEWYTRLGIGRFLTRDQIEARPQGRASSLLSSVPGVALRPVPFRTASAILLRTQARGVCTPAVYLDGSRIDSTEVDDLVDARQIHGVEVYRGLTEMPGEYHDRNFCGVVLIWTVREPSGSGAPLSWRNIVIAAGITVLTVWLISR
jgi:hypothetical protein